ARRARGRFRTSADGFGIGHLHAQTACLRELPVVRGLQGATAWHSGNAACPQRETGASVEARRGVCCARQDGRGVADETAGERIARRNAAAAARTVDREI